MAPGWTQQDTYRATFTVPLSGTSCAQRLPVAPGVTQPVCTEGSVAEPTLRLPTTDGITYSVDPPGPYSAGQAVTVTATLGPAGVGLPGPALLTPGWTKTSATTATYPVTFDQVACAPVAPVAPSVTPATCVDGEVIEPTISLPTTAGVVYAVDPPGPYGSRRPTDVVVTASLLDGFAWGELPSGWRLTKPDRGVVPRLVAGVSGVRNTGDADNDDPDDPDDADNADNADDPDNADNPDDDTERWTGADNHPGRAGSHRRRGGADPTRGHPRDSRPRRRLAFWVSTVEVGGRQRCSNEFQDHPAILKLVRSDRSACRRELVFQHNSAGRVVEESS